MYARSVHLVFEYCDNDLACMLEAMSRPFLESEVSPVVTATDVDLMDVVSVHSACLGV